MIRIGIDVGGTNTDAVIMDGERVIASFKAPTSPDVMSGVSESLKGALTESGVPAQAIDVVMLGTALHHAVVPTPRLGGFPMPPRAGSPPTRDRAQRAPGRSRPRPLICGHQHASSWLREIAV